MKTKQKIFLLFALLIAGFIFYTSGQSQPYGVSGCNEFIPKAYHFSIFFLLALCLILSKEKQERGFIFLAIMISLVYALLDELHQYFVPGRECSLGDFVIDSLGILASFAFLFIIGEIKNAE